MNTVLTDENIITLILQFRTIKDNLIDQIYKEK